MQKTKLGLSVGLVGAALYFLGLYSFIPAFLLAGYVLLKEENEWLRKSAVRMLALVLGFYLLGLAVDCIDEIFGVINVFVSWFDGPVISVPLRLNSLCNYFLWFAKVFVMLMFGFLAFKQNPKNLAVIDDLGKTE